MNSEHLKNAAVGALVVATLVTGVIVLAPGDGRDDRPAPTPAARARAAAAAGAPAALPDLNALITDRERRLRARPRDDESWAVLGAAYAERGTRLGDWASFPKAETALRRSLELRPGDRGNTDALLGLAALANARQDFRAARTWAQRAEKQRPRQWTVYPALIDAYSGLGDYESAGKSLDRLTRLHSGSRARAASARIYRDLGWREDAAANAYDAVGGAQGPVEKAVALRVLGDLAWERGEPAEAIESYDHALRLVPDHHPALASRARALASLGRTDEAFRDYRAAFARHPLPEYALETGELYESLGLDTDAQAQYAAMRAAAGQAAANGVDTDLTLARWEADHGAPESAIDRLRPEWIAGRRTPQLADALGWAFFKAGRSKDALPYARKAVEGLRTPLILYHRGEIERARGRYGPARRHIGQALRVNPYFSPLLAPLARNALAALGEPPPGGPKKMTGREGREGKSGSGARRDAAGVEGTSRVDGTVGSGGTAGNGGVGR